MAQRRGDYGFDAPYVPIIFLCIGLAVIVLGLLAFLLWQSPLWGIVCLLYGMYMLLSSASYIYTTRRGKFQVWAELLVGLNLLGDELHKLGAPTVVLWTIVYIDEQRLNLRKTLFGVSISRWPLFFPSRGRPSTCPASYGLASCLLVISRILAKQRPGF